ASANRKSQGRRLGPSAGGSNGHGKATLAALWRRGWLCLLSLEPAGSQALSSLEMASLKATRSPGTREVISVNPLAGQRNTESSFQLPPALMISVLIESYEVRVLPWTRPASTSSHGPWQMDATGRPEEANDFT